MIDFGPEIARALEVAPAPVNTAAFIMAPCDRDFLVRYFSANMRSPGIPDPADPPPIAAREYYLGIEIKSNVYLAPGVVACADRKGRILGFLQLYAFPS
jgi:hypothetical protein